MKKQMGILISSLFVLGFSFLLVNNLKGGDEVVRDKKIIVELKDVNGDDLESRNKVEEVFKRELQSVVGLNYRITSNLKCASNILFIDVDSKDVSKIEALALVENVKEAKTYAFNYENITGYNPTYDFAAPDKNYSKITMNIDEDSKDGENTIIAVLDDSFEIDHEAFDEIKEAEVRYSKDDIKNILKSDGFVATEAKYKNNKVPFYYSYATKNTDLTYKRNYYYHGTNVAGIAASNSQYYEGISKNAQLALMKVSDASGNLTSDTAILNALNDCATLDVDAINMSFGLGIVDFDFVNDLYQSVFDKLNQKGIAINFAAGNDGRDQYSLKSIANLQTSSSETSILGGYLLDDNTTSVASIYNKDDYKISTSICTLDGQIIKVNNVAYYTIKSFSYLIPEDNEQVELDYVVVPKYGRENDYQNIDVNNKIALISRKMPTDSVDSSFKFVDKITNATKNGAKAIIFYNYEGATNLFKTIDFEDYPILYSEDSVPLVYTNSYYGNLLVNQENKRLIISKELVSEFTSNGSTASLQLKPDIAAPGSDIFGPTSAANKNYEYSEDEYAYYSGTSMATPNYSGAFVNILSNYDISNEEDRITKRKELVARIMSTADPLKQINGAYYSPRLVGAGKVDAKGAYKSNVYLLGNNSNKAKIELKNNDDIKEGNIKFEVKTINESNETKSYSLKLVVEAPEVVGADTSFGTKIENGKYQTSKDILLREVSLGQIQVIPGESKFEVSTTIAEENKKYLNKNFENGTYLEGYLMLTSLDNEEDLSIPYMGYYGDYNKEEPIEPFNFEKDENKVYGSDLLNYYIRNDGYGSSEADYSSMIVFLKNNLNIFQTNAVQTNSKSFTSYGKEIQFDTVNNEIVLDQNGKEGKFVVQQFVNRSVASNTISMINKKTGIDVISHENKVNGYRVDQMHSFLLSEYDKNSAGKLYKSYILDSISTLGYYADRAYSSFDFSNTKQFPNGVEDGLYELKFEYTLVDGSIFTKSYNFRVGRTIDFSDANITSETIIEINNEKYLDLRFSGSDVSKIRVNNIDYEFTEEKTGYYALINLKDFGEYNKSIFIELIDRYGNRKTSYIDITSEFSIVKNGLENDGTVRCTSEKYKNYIRGYLYTLSIENSKGNELTFDEDATITFNLIEGESTEKLKIYVFTGKGLGEEIKYEINGNKITLKTNSNKFVMLYDDSRGFTNEQTMIITGVSVVAISGVALAIMMVIKKNERVNKEK